MQLMYKPDPPFTGQPYQCAKCLDIIWSKFSGQYVSCKCGAIAVDQTAFYERRIGDLENFQKVVA